MPDKKQRVFVRTPNSDGQWWYVGGPELEDVMNGIKAVIIEDVRALMREKLGNIEIEFDTQDLTDEEVEQLPDC